MAHRRPTPLVAPAAGFASEPAASEVEVPAAVREALERYVAEPTDANLQAVVDLQSDSGRASRSSDRVGCMSACAGYMYWKGVMDINGRIEHVFNWLNAYMEQSQNGCACDEWRTYYEGPGLILQGTPRVDISHSLQKVPGLGAFPVSQSTAYSNYFPWYKC